MCLSGARKSVLYAAQIIDHIDVVRTGKVRRALVLDLGYEYYKMADYEEAVSTWKKVPKVKDELYVKTLNNLGSAYILQKKFVDEEF